MHCASKCFSIPEDLSLKIFNNRDFVSNSDLENELKNYKRLSKLTFVHCRVKDNKYEAIFAIPTLKAITFQNCSGEFMKMFINQSFIATITVINRDNVHNGFSDAEFDELVRNLPNLKHLKLLGLGTQSYLENGEFPFQIETLECESISNSWHHKKDNQRLKFLKSQVGCLKELIINELPHDSYGGEILCYIFDEMRLTKFICNKTTLILNGIQQDVKEINVTEVQFEALCEILRRFPSK